ncbi:L,D-transpeptidase family protein [Novosphingobium sp.]|uniref:L,D-transpeptidase family protein n=2 Tax=unclassified Novosphingobium TaxID=2644732 RepID=UPI002B9598EC|nr:L,D-transpeptidase family protein [Novosphingobium sp.]HQV02768.1 L,D-transpeptidase family protein [Novosphingobium sp.]
MIRAAAVLGATFLLLLVAGLAIPGLEAVPGAHVAQAQASAVLAPMPAKPAAQKVQLPPPVTKVLQSGVLIVVSKSSRQMFVFKDGALWAKSPVSTGKRGHGTPNGVFPILQKRKFHRSNLYSNAPMPFMQRLTWSGIAIHAGHVPAYNASHGCIRVPHGFARSLFALTRAEATTVVVTNAAVKSDQAAISMALNMPMPGTSLPGSAAPPVLASANPPPQIEALVLVPVQSQPAPTGQTIQLAAAQSQAEADALWADLTNRHPQLLGTQRMIIPAVVGSRRVYRLRTTAPGAHALCSELKRSGTACFNVS